MLGMKPMFMAFWMLWMVVSGVGVELVRAPFVLRTFPPRSGGNPAAFPPHLSSPSPSPPDQVRGRL